MMMIIMMMIMLVRVGVGDNDDASEVTGERSAEDHADELLLQQEHIVPVRGECPTAEEWSMSYNTIPYSYIM